MIEIPAFSIECVFGCVPSNAVDNLSLLTDLLGAAKADSIVKATGFSTRCIAAQGQSVFDLALPAARRALEGVSAEDVGGVVAVTFSNPGRFPALSVRLQNALGLPQGIAAFDVGMACSGYPYGLFVAGQLASATGKKVLLIDGDVQSAHVDASDPNTLAVMGDGASATLVSAHGGSAKFAFHTDGSGADVLRCGADGKIRMDGSSPPPGSVRTSSRRMPPTCIWCGSLPRHSASMIALPQAANCTRIPVRAPCRSRWLLPLGRV